jgi:transglutaminase-like putative cysteine protease
MHASFSFIQGGLLSSFFSLERTYFMLLIVAMTFARDFLPDKIIAFNGALLLLRLFIHRLPTLIIYLAITGLIVLIRTTFHRFFIPEATVSFLIGLCSIRLLQDYKDKDKRSDYLLGFLFIGGLSLFNTTMGFMLYIAITSLLCFVLLAEIDWKELQLLVSLKTLAKYAIFVIPLTMALFFFFPRFRSFFPSANSGLTGEIGYSKEVNNSQTANLSLSSKIAFYATVPESNMSELYWRGRVLNYTDGYNWKNTMMYSRGKELKFRGEPISYEMKYEQHFNGDIILLDTPQKIVTSQLRTYGQNGSQTFHSYVKKKKNMVSAISYNTPPTMELSKQNRQLYLQKPDFVPKKIKQLMQDFKGQNPKDIIIGIRNYLRQNGFVYTLNPGPMPTMNHFLDNKKGYCTHYAALMALIFRHYNIPSRLVSGFQGGTFNDVGKHYTVRSSDAHAWVEFWQDNQWKRIDPTQFVAPMRIAQGANFNSDGALTRRSPPSGWLSKRFYEFGQYFDNINYQVSLFLDNYDRSYQKLLAEKLKLSLRYFYLLGFLLIVPLMIFFWKYMGRKNKIQLSIEDQYFNKFNRYLGQENINIKSNDGMAQIYEKLQNLPVDKRTYAQNFLKAYEHHKYSTRKIENQLKQAFEELK